VSTKVTPHHQEQHVLSSFIIERPLLGRYLTATMLQTRTETVKIVLGQDLCKTCPRTIGGRY